MRRLKRKVGLKRRLLAGVAVVTSAVLAAFIGRGDLSTVGGAGPVAGDPCADGAPSAGIAAADGGGSDRGLLWRLYPAAHEPGLQNDETARLFHAALPGGLDELTSVEERKSAFVSVVLPIIDRVNREIMRHRRLVEIAATCRADGRPVGAAVRAEILRLHERYRTGGDVAALRHRLDIVPPSLAIAQAAIESGWGTSRFVVLGNALFGQRTTNPRRGMRPADLPPTTPVRVAAFDHLTASVRAYVRNLNSHPAYRGFRARRAALRRSGDGLDGLTLAGTLIAYSSRGTAYVRDLRSIIRGNRLAAFDEAAGTAWTRTRTSRSET